MKNKSTIIQSTQENPRTTKKDMYVNGQKILNTYKNMD